MMVGPAPFLPTQVLVRGTPVACQGWRESSRLTPRKIQKKRAARQATLPGKGFDASRKNVLLWASICGLQQERLSSAYTAWSTGIGGQLAPARWFLDLPMQQHAIRARITSIAAFDAEAVPGTEALRGSWIQPCEAPHSV